MASLKAQQLAAIRPHWTYLGNYQTNFDKQVGRITTTRAFSPGSIIESRDEREYCVHVDGSFRRIN